MTKKFVLSMIPRNGIRAARGQTSLETILLIAGTLAFFVAVIPLVNQAADATTLLAEKTQHQQELEKIAIAATEVDAFGPGNSFYFTVVLRQTAEVELGDGLATLSFESGKEKIMLQANTTKKAFTKLILQKGRHELSAQNNEGMVSIKTKDD